MTFYIKTLTGNNVRWKKKIWLYIRYLHSHIDIWFMRLRTIFLYSSTLFYIILHHLQASMVNYDVQMMKHSKNCSFENQFESKLRIFDKFFNKFGPFPENHIRINFDFQACFPKSKPQKCSSFNNFAIFVCLTQLITVSAVNIRKKKSWS